MLLYVAVLYEHTVSTGVQRRLQLQGESEQPCVQSARHQPQVQVHPHSHRGGPPPGDGHEQRDENSDTTDNSTNGRSADSCRPRNCPP